MRVRVRVRMRVRGRGRGRARGRARAMASRLVDLAVGREVEHAQHGGPAARVALDGARGHAQCLLPPPRRALCLRSEVLTYPALRQHRRLGRVRVRVRAWG